MNERREKLKAAVSAETKLELHAADPTYSAGSMPVEEARRKLDQLIDEFIQAAAAWNDEQDDDNPFVQFANRESPSPPPVHAMRVSTGVGKTQMFAAGLARYILARRAAGDKGSMATRSWLYSVPTHRLGEDIAKHFRDHGLTATVYRGRKADDPTILGNMEQPKGERVKMCLDLEKVDLAIACRQDITKSCCLNKKTKQQCAFYDQCGYQQQFRGDQPDVWIGAHNMLFHSQKHFGNNAGVVADETFYKQGMWGIETHEGDLTLDDFSTPTDFGAPENHGYHLGRNKLFEILREHRLGGLERACCVDKIQPEDCTRYIQEEWKIFNNVELTPQMTADELAEVEKTMPACRRARRMVGIWGALRELLEKPEIAVSGRLVLEKNKAGKIILRCRGVRPIIEARNVPTAILDATLPDVSILQAFYPQVEVVANIEVEMPHVHTRQVIGAPVSKLKLWGTERRPAVGEHNLEAIRRSLLQRWVESGRQSMLVICQKQAEEWLKNSELPVGITVEHYNNISGIDRYKDVRSLILIGRTIPSPTVVEAYAGAITGAEPVKAATTGNWYDRVTRGIRLADGSGIGVENCDEHPDPVAEAVRRQICEAELMQALGRARGVNRTAGTPLNVDILADVVLPVTVNEVISWQEPSEVVEMAVEGIVLNSPGDMTKAWPKVWATADIAKWTLKKLKALYRKTPLSSAGRAGARTESGLSIEKNLSIGNPLSVHAEAALYQPRGPKQKRRPALFDPRILPNPRPWLEKRLGAIASLFHLLRKGEIAPLAPEGG
jgi:putative DNA primase/helicase